MAGSIRVVSLFSCWSRHFAAALFRFRLLSHTYSLAVYAPIQADLFAINLEKPLKSAWSFDDWDEMETHFSDADIAQADKMTPETASVYIGDLRAAGRQARGWHFAENPKTRYLTLCLPYWTNDWTRLMLGLNILRQILPTSGDGEPGYILAHRFDGADSKTLGAILMRHGTTKVVGPHADVTQQIVKHASPLASRVQAMAKMPTPHVVDTFGALRH